MRQFYQIWNLYADDYQQYAVPCTYQEEAGAPPSATKSAEIDWWQYQLIGQELGRAGQGIIGWLIGEWAYRLQHGQLGHYVEHSQMSIG